MSGILNNIYNNISFALQMHTRALVRLQEQASTGSFINRPSDEPSSAYQVLGLNSEQGAMENYIDNLSGVVTTLELSTTILGDMVSYLTETKTSLTQISSGIYDQEGRQRVATVVNDALEQMILLANTENMDQYLFGGSNSSSPPYVVERTNGKITSVTYQGSMGEREIEIAPGVQTVAFSVGNDIFHSDNRSTPIFLGDTGAKAGTGTSNVEGDVWLTVTHDGSNYQLSIDDGVSTVTVPVGGDTNQAVTSSVTGRVLYVDSTEINSTGIELVQVPGTHDVFNTLITIRDILENDRGLSNDQLSDLFMNIPNALNEIMSLLIQGQASFGAKIGFLDNLKNSLTSLKYNAEDEVTRIQEADIAQIAIDLSRHEVLYEMSLSMASRLLSVSLLDFIT